MRIFPSASLTLFLVAPSRRLSPAVPLSLSLLIAAAGCGGAAASGGGTIAGTGGPSIVVTPEMGSPHVGDLAPDFDVATPSGEHVTLASLRGSPVFLTTATSWCPFSQAEQPAIARLAADYAAQGVKVVVVDIDEEQAGYRTYATRTSMPGPVYWSARGEALAAFVPPNAQPSITRDRWKLLVTTNLVIDVEGRIRFYTLVDTLHFDAQLAGVRSALDALVSPPS